MSAHSTADLQARLISHLSAIRGLAGQAQRCVEDHHALAIVLGRIALAHAEACELQRELERASVVRLADFDRETLRRQTYGHQGPGARPSRRS